MKYESKQDYERRRIQPSRDAEAHKRLERLCNNSNSSEQEIDRARNPLPRRLAYPCRLS